MRIWKIWRKAGISADDLKKAEMLEAYTRWLKNERLSRKQKRLLKEINNVPELQPLKQLIDFSHYRFEERENIEPPSGAQERARERVMAEIRGDGAEASVPTDGLEPQPGYSPQGMGNETTEIMKVGASSPNAHELRRWDTEQTPASPETLNRYEDIRSLPSLHLQFEQKDDGVYVTDMGSSNTTYVDNERVAMSAPVREGSTLRCGKISLKVTNIESS